MTAFLQASVTAEVVVMVIMPGFSFLPNTSNGMLVCITKELKLSNSLVQRIVRTSSCSGTPL